MSGTLTKPGYYFPAFLIFRGAQLASLVGIQSVLVANILTRK